MILHDLLKGDGVVAFDTRIEGGLLFASLLVSKTASPTRLFARSASEEDSLVLVGEIVAPGDGLFYGIDIPISLEALGSA